MGLFWCGLRPVLIRRSLPRVSLWSRCPRFSMERKHETLVLDDSAPLQQACGYIRDMQILRCLGRASITLRLSCMGVDLAYRYTTIGIASILSASYVIIIRSGEIV